MSIEGPTQNIKVRMSAEMLGWTAGTNIRSFAALKGDFLVAQRQAWEGYLCQPEISREIGAAVISGFQTKVDPSAVELPESDPILLNGYRGQLDEHILRFTGNSGHVDQEKLSLSDNPRYQLPDHFVYLSCLDVNRHITADNAARLFNPGKQDMLSSTSRLASADSIREMCPDVSLPNARALSLMFQKARTELHFSLGDKIRNVLKDAQNTQTAFWAVLDTVPNSPMYVAELFANQTLYQSPFGENAGDIIWGPTDAVAKLLDSDYLPAEVSGPVLGRVYRDHACTSTSRSFPGCGVSKLWGSILRSPYLDREKAAAIVRTWNRETLGLNEDDDIVFGPIFEHTRSLPDGLVPNIDQLRA